MVFSACGRSGYGGGYSEQSRVWESLHEERIKELDALLLAANENMALLTTVNAEPTAGLAEAERTNKKLRRGARQDGDSLRSQIKVLQSHRS
ncbi:MAG: hypothetical protein PSW75_12760 [bacterium]|nr:hypothetical protein [bacterium]MDI1336642.1 hypothetical protein [Lacunisphaera sp.]